MVLLNTAFSYYRKLLCIVFETALLITIGYATDVNMPVLIGAAGLIFVGHHLFDVVRELYPNSLLFREPTFWLFGALTAFAMVLVGIVYGLVYVRLV